MIVRRICFLRFKKCERFTVIEKVRSFVMYQLLAAFDDNVAGAK